jgi:hypothetical protein
VSSLFHSIIHVNLDSPRGSWAPIRKHGVGQDIDVDCVALQAVLLIEPTEILWGSVPIASLHKGIPHQYREVVMVLSPHVQVAILKGAV